MVPMIDAAFPLCTAITIDPSTGNYVCAFPQVCTSFSLQAIEYVYPEPCRQLNMSLFTGKYIFLSRQIHRSFFSKMKSTFLYTGNKVCLFLYNQLLECLCIIWRVSGWGLLFVSSICCPHFWTSLSIRTS